MTPPPPDDYEALIRLIHERFDGMSPSYRQIAQFLTQSPNEVAVLSVNAAAARVGIHASSFVRFAQSLGYRGFKDLQGLFQKRLATAAPGFEARSKALRSKLEERADRSDMGLLREMVVQDAAAVEALLEDIPEADLAAAAETLVGARTIYILGQLRAEPVARLIRYMLTMLGLRAVLLDATGGLATHMARTMGPEDALVVVSFRFYATEVVTVAEETRARGVPIVAITDSTLSPLARSADTFLAVPERNPSLARSLAAPISLAQVLCVCVAARVQEGEAAPRVPSATEPG